MPITLDTAAGRVTFRLNGERFADYVHSHDGSGFAGVFVGGRRLTREGTNTRFPVRVQPAMATIDGQAAGLSIRSRDLVARRGGFSVGFREIREWIDENGEPIIDEVRTIRAGPAPSEGGQIDLTIQLSTALTTSVELARSDRGLALPH